MELFTPDFGLIFWMFVSFGILFLVLWRFAWPVILKSLDERADLIDKGVEYSREAQSRMENATKEAQSYIDEARKKEAEILREAERMKTQIIEQARVHAQEEAQKIELANRQKIAQQEKQAEAELRNHVGEIAIAIADRVLRGHMSQDDEQKKLVDSLLTEMEQKN